ncbi:MAG: Ni/Fe hydrogenase subunit alpha [Armatimonadota bacterium]
MQTKTIEIDVHHITRVEGHGNIRVRATDGVIEQVRWQVPEAPRFFEAMVRGRRWDDIQTIVSRICGICSVAHSLAALKAIEDAMSIRISEQTDRLRLLALYGELLESHFLHVGYLVSPDLLGVKSVIPLVKSHPELVKVIIRLHRLGNTIMEVIAGRRTHPVAFRPGGFGKLPTKGELRELQQAFENAKIDAQLLADAVLGLAEKIPAFSRDTEYIALTDPGVYTFYHGKISSTDTTKTMPVQNFKSVVNEYVTAQSTAKWAHWHRESYMVGALARYKLNGDYLLPWAADTAAALGLTRDCCNPFMNSAVQLVECLHLIEHGVQLIDTLLTAGITPEFPRVKPVAGWGVGAVEAPRGILFHNYAFDENGICTSANMCIPTNQNHANIQKDFEAFLPQIINREQDEVRLLLEMLVRAYDPCISCSTHYLNVEFV